jgi:hypothetical protein
VLRLRFEVDYASRSDGRPDAPGEDVAATLAEKQAQLAEAHAAVEVRARDVHNTSLWPYGSVVGSFLWPMLLGRDGTLRRYY